ncbi:MAG TPA: hypothetical protein VF262_05355 [Burkholderiales bacterium]
MKSLLAWLIILGLAIANGAFREAVLIPSLGKRGGLVLSGVVLSALVVLVAYGLVRVSKGVTVSQGFLIGALWLGLTLVFEFAFGRLVQHQTWDALLDAYTFKDGNIWPVVLAVTFLAPPLAALTPYFRGAGGSCGRRSPRRCGS